MSYNKRELKTKSTAKKLAKPKDVIVDSQGQKNHPWEVTKIPGNSMTTEGYGNIPLYVIPDKGQPQMIMPNTGDHYFPNANSFTEYPQEMKKGGQNRTPKNFTNQNIQSSINDLFTRNQLLFGPGGRNRYSPLSTQENMKKSTKLKKYPEGGIPYKDSLDIYNYSQKFNNLLDSAQGNYDIARKKVENWYSTPEAAKFNTLIDKHGIKINDPNKMIKAPNQGGVDYTYARYNKPVAPAVNPIAQTQPITPTATITPQTIDPNWQFQRKKFTGFTDPNVQGGYNKTNNYNVDNTNTGSQLIPSPIFGDGGIAYPQQPTQKQFFNFGPKPDQFPLFLHGGINTNGIAYPQQPTEKVFFSGAPWTPEYNLGGHLQLPEAYPQQPTQEVFFSGTSWNPEYSNGGSNVDKKTFSNGQPRTGPYAGPSGGAPSGSYPIPDIKHAKAAIMLSGHAPNPAGIKSAVYAKYPQLKKQDGGITSGIGMMDNMNSDYKFGGSNMLRDYFRKMAIGGDTDLDGDNNGSTDFDEDDYRNNLTKTFTNKLKNNTMMSIADEASQHVQDQFAQMGMNMGDYGYDPNMNNNQMYQNKYNFMNNQQQNAGQNFMDQSMNMIQKYAQDGGTGKNKMSPELWQQYQDYYNSDQGTPGPSYQSTYNTNQWNVNNNSQGYKHFPANTHQNQNQWTVTGNPGDMQFNPNNTYLNNVSQENQYGALDRFVAGFRKKDAAGNHSKHTFGPKSTTTTLNFRTYTDPNTGLNTQVPVNSASVNPTDEHIQSMQQNGYTGPMERDPAVGYKYGGLHKAQMGDTMAPNFLNMNVFGQPFNPNAMDIGNAGQPGFIDNPMNNYKNTTIANTQGRNKINGEDSANWIMSGIAGATALANNPQMQQAQLKMQNNTLADNQFTAQPANRINNQGRYNWTGMSNGMMDPNSMGVIQQPGNNFGNSNYKDGGEYHLTQDEIDSIIVSGGNVQYLD